MPLYVKPLSNICLKTFSCLGFFFATTRMISFIWAENFPRNLSIWSNRGESPWAIRYSSLISIFLLTVALKFCLISSLIGILTSVYWVLAIVHRLQSIEKPRKIFFCMLIRHFKIFSIAFKIHIWAFLHLKIFNHRKEVIKNRLIIYIYSKYS